MKINEEINLFDGYSLKKMEVKEFFELQKSLDKEVFSAFMSFNTPQVLSEQEMGKIEILKSNVGDIKFLCFGIFFENNLVGWSWGRQKNEQDYGMVNSGILKEHRRKGLYSAMLKTVLDVLTEEGFQVIHSSHHPTNNNVIIPKLKAGFIISGMDVSDRFGTFVKLSYFTNKLRREVMDFRVGHKRPNDKIKKLLAI